MKENEIKRVEILSEIIKLAKEYDYKEKLISELENYEDLDKYFNEQVSKDKDYVFNYGLFLLYSLIAVEDLVLVKNSDVDLIKIFNPLDESKFNMVDLKLIQKINEYKSIVSVIIIEEKLKLMM